jgi:hypothetical protein
MALSGDDLLQRWPAVRPFLLVGAACIVAGGIVAAVTRPTGFGEGSWLAAYLVLVTGVAQIALGAGQAWLSAGVPTRRLALRELVAWNAGVAAVIAGTLIGAPLLTTLGGLASLVALALFLGGVRRTGVVPAWAALGYRGVAVIVLVSIPVGLVLAWLRHG